LKYFQFKGAVFLLHNEGTFISNKIQLYYQSWHPAKEPSRAIIVGVHGHGDHSGGHLNMIHELVRNGYSWYGFDLRGHGRSPGNRGHVESWSDYLDDLQEFLDLVRGFEAESSIFILGHSLGGLISLEYALRNPSGLKGIIAISPAINYSGLSPRAIWLVQHLSHLKPNFGINQQPEYAKLTRDPTVIKKLATDSLRHDRMTLGLGREVIRAQHWVQTHPEYLRVPLLMLYGLNDSITPAAGIQEFFNAVVYTDKKQHRYEQTRHRPFDDLNRSEVLGHLVAWLDQHCEVANQTICSSHVKIN
jgi:acylglycerol lipase